MNWYAVYTKYRSEKHVVGQLRKRGIEAYVPLLRRTRRYERKVKSYEMPLINCYVFVRIPEERRVEVLRVPYVHRFLTIEGKIVPIPVREMEIMQRVVGELHDVTCEAIMWEPGDDVEIIPGTGRDHMAQPFQGLADHGLRQGAAEGIVFVSSFHRDFNRRLVAGDAADPHAARVVSGMTDR